MVRRICSFLVLLGFLPVSSGWIHVAHHQESHHGSGQESSHAQDCDHPKSDHDSGAQDCPTCHFLTQARSGCCIAPSLQLIDAAAAPLVWTVAVFDEPIQAAEFIHPVPRGPPQLQ